jgi:acyl transferase domain-containing protein
MEPIAVIGIGCRFPKANNPEAFWQLLRNGVDAIAPVPKERWNVDNFYDPNSETPGKMNARWGGFLEDVDRFDADFFGISADEAEHSDPQQRLFLEVAWEALENAAIVPASLAGSQTGVFIGLCTIDYHRLLYKNFSCIGPYSGTGTTPCVTANRLSYMLDLRGPSMAIDTACSSSLVTVHLACQSLRSGESDLCLAGGVNLILSPDSTISSSQTGMLSANYGRCKTFDASADGYVRGEGCGVVTLKRLSDAVRDRDNILALIRGSAVNHNGLSNSMSAPNGLAQQATIRQALKNADVKPSEINYIDAHAVGTAIGDAIEFKAIKTVLMEDREFDRPCRIGSIKTNIGHLEAAAGVSALIKVVLSLQHEEIPPHLHLNELNSYVSLDDTPFSIPTELQKWDCSDKESRLAGVSAFGFGGTNAHIIVGEFKSDLQRIGNREQATGNSEYLELKTEKERPQHILTLSAKSDSALREMAQRYEYFLASHPETSIADLCFTANTGRSHFEHRLAIVTESIAQLQQQLQDFIAQKETNQLLKGKVKGRKRPQVAFVFPGKDLEDRTIECEFYKTQPVFCQAIELCKEVAYFGKLYGFRKGELIQIENTSSYKKDVLWNVSTMAMFAIEYALAKLWQSWGINPKVVTGYGVGEYVAATIAGVFSLENALKLAVERTRFMQASLHSKQSIEAFKKIAKQVVYFQPKIPLVSSLTGEIIGEEIATPEYWCQQLQRSEKYPAGIKVLTGNRLFLTIGAKPNALSEEMGVCLASLRSQKEDWQEILHSLAELYIRGVAIDWSGFNNLNDDCDYSRRRLQLPTYPFQRQRYWFKTPEHKQQEEIEQIAESLKEKGNLSEAQIKLLPELLEALADRQKTQVNGSSAETIRG